MDVTMEIALKVQELGKTHAIRGAAVAGHGESVRQLAHRAKLVTRLLMFALHHANRVLDGAEWTWPRRVDRSRAEVSDVREQHTLLFGHVLHEVARHLVEQDTNLQEFGMPLPVHLSELRQMAGDHRNRRAQVLVVGRKDVIDQSRERPVGLIAW